MPAPTLSPVPTAKPALATPGVVLGGGGGLVVLGAVLDRAGSILMDPGFTWAASWQPLSGLALLSAILLGWGYLSACRPEVITGIAHFDGEGASRG